MDPFTFIIIVKALGLAKGFLPAAKVEQFFDDVFKEALQQEITGSIYTLTRLHSALVLLQAAAGQLIQPGNLGAGSPPEKGHIIAAYDSQEVGGVTNKLVGDLKPEEISGHFTTAIAAMTNIIGGEGANLINTVSTKTAPVLDLFFQELKVIGLPPQNFDPDDCLKQCLASISAGAPFHPDSRRYAALALPLFKLLWGTDINSCLAEVAVWLGQLPGGPGAAEAWLEQKLQFNSLAAPLGTVYPSGKAETKLALDRITVMLTANMQSFGQIYNRFIEGPVDTNMLKVTIANLVQATQEPAWNHLLGATCSRMVWEAYRQVNLTVELARLIL